MMICFLFPELWYDTMAVVGPSDCEPNKETCEKICGFVAD